MNLRCLFQCTCIGFIASTVSWAFAEPSPPENQYFRGVEDRLAEADAVVVGWAEIIRQEFIRETSRKEVRARINVTAVLKGEEALREIEYTSAYTPKGYTSFSGKGYWSTEDEEHCRLVECFPYALRHSAIFFLKREQNMEWKPFYAYLDDDEQTIQHAVETIIAAQKQLSEKPTTEILVPLLQAKYPLVLRKYAVRALMRYGGTWPERSNVLRAAVGQLDNDDALYSYTVACVVAHIRYEGDAPRVTSGLDLVVALIENAPNEATLNFAVRQIRRISSVFLANQGEAKAFREALLKKRGGLTGKIPGHAVLTQQDEALLSDIVPGSPIRGSDQTQ